MAYRTLTSVTATLMYGGKAEEGRVGIATTNDGRRLFGLCDRWCPDYTTHMAYAFDKYFMPSDVLNHARTKGEGWFWFDAGTTCTEIKISADELERVFFALGLIETPKSAPTAVDSSTEDLAYVMNELHDARTELEHRRGHERNLRDIAHNWQTLGPSAVDGIHARMLLNVLDAPGSIPVLAGHQELDAYDRICEIMSQYDRRDISDSTALHGIAEQIGE